MRDSIHAADTLNTIERSSCETVPKIENPVPTKNPPHMTMKMLQGYPGID